MQFCKDYSELCLGSGTVAPFSSKYDDCMAETTAMPEGKKGTPSGNSFSCREYHLFIGMNVPGERMSFHCPHASATGGGICEDEKVEDAAGAIKCNDNGRKDPMWGTVLHGGTPDQCTEYANQLTNLAVSCGKKAASRPGKGFSCMASKENPSENLLGTVGTAKDCKGLAGTVTKALKKIQRKPVIKFTCEPYGDTGFMRMYVKSKKKCSTYTDSTNNLMKLFLDKKFEKCTAPAKEPSMYVNCMEHHGADVTTEVFQSSVATCPAQVAGINKLLKSCGLNPKYEGGVACSAGVDGSSMIIASGDASTTKLTKRAWTKAMRAYSASLPTVDTVAGAFTNARKCFLLAPALNAMIKSGWVCPAPE